MRRRIRFWVPVLACAALLVLPIAPAANTAPPARFELPFGADRTPLPAGLPRELAQPWALRSGFDAGDLLQAIGAAPSTNPSELVLVTLWPRDLSFYSNGAGTPPLTNEQILADYAPSPAVYDSVAAYFVAHNLTIAHAWPDHLSITLRGSAAALGSAFGTELMEATWDGRAVQLPASVPTLPASIEQAISAVSGLSDGFTDFTVPLEPARPAQVLPARTTSLVSPSEVHGLYGLNGLYNYSGSSHWATGVGIALVLWGRGYAPSDIQSFYSNYYPSGFPPITYAGYPVDGAPLPSNSAVNDPSNVTSEMTLDMEWAGSAAPGATLSAVYAPDGPAKDNYSPSDAGLEDALSQAVESIAGTRVVSMSFGTPDGSDPSFQAAFTQILADASTRGITALAASGDTGGDARLGCLGGASPEFPAVSSYVVAVGGTAPQLAVDAFGSITGLASEPAWNRSGGGFSTTVGEPVWQNVGSAAGPIRAGGGRGIPDVAGPANDNMFFYDGQETAGAGTSFASPMWAGIVAEMDALHGTPLGFVTPRLYAVGGAESNRTTAIGLADITAGSNCLGPARVGWDTATGWGVPRALALYEDLSGTYVNVSLVTSTSAVAPGQTFGATVSVTNATSLAPIVGALVTFSLDSVNYVGPCGGSIGSTEGSTAVTGDASSSLTVPGCFLGLSLRVTATVSGGPYFGSNVTTVHVNLIGLAGFLAFVQVFPYNYLSFAGIMLLAVLVGWRVGNWRERRSRAARRPANGRAPGTGNPAASGPSPTAGAPAAPTNGASAPRAAPAASTSSRGPMAPVAPSVPATQVDATPSSVVAEPSGPLETATNAAPPIDAAALSAVAASTPASGPSPPVELSTDSSPPLGGSTPITPAPAEVAAPSRRPATTRTSPARSRSPNATGKATTAKPAARRTSAVDATSGVRSPAPRKTVAAPDQPPTPPVGLPRVCPVCKATALSSAATCEVCGAALP
jgi:kumamolisin